MPDYISEDELFPDEVLEEGTIFFFFECKNCRTRWISTMCYCPHCKGVYKFKILDSQEYEDQVFIQMLADKFHYAMLLGEK